MRGHKNKKNLKKQVPKLLDKIKAAFDCSGTFQLKDQMKIFYQSGQGSGKIIFPGPSQQSITKAIQYSSKSGFGKGKQNVMDQQYRMAFQYRSDQLGLPSQLLETISSQICESISHAIGKKQKVKAQLIKLNIYPQGGLFKSHVDSPKGTAFGSLVVFLPSYFEGGQLIISQNDQTHSYNFGSGKNQSSYVNWVAFYNDCVHEITEVTAGYRLTLSYNLFYTGIPSSVEVFPTESMVKSLSTLENNKFYGYYCEHYYGNNALQNVKQGQQVQVLKGKDFDLFNSAKKIGIVNLQIKALYHIQNNYIYQEDQERHKNFTGPPHRISEIKMGEVYDQNYHDINPFHTIVAKYQGSQIDLNQVIWLNTAKDVSKYRYAINGYYGNDYSLGQSYCELIILIKT